jgi:hypothetical protein
MLVTPTVLTLPSPFRWNTRAFTGELVRTWPTALGLCHSRLMLVVAALCGHADLAPLTAVPPPLPSPFRPDLGRRPRAPRRCSVLELPRDLGKQE